MTDTSRSREDDYIKGLWKTNLTPMEYARQLIAEGNKQGMKDKNMLLKKNYALGEEYGRKMQKIEDDKKREVVYYNDADSFLNGKEEGRRQALEDVKILISCCDELGWNERNIRQLKSKLKELGK